MWVPSNYPSKSSRPTTQPLKPIHSDHTCECDALLGTYAPNGTRQNRTEHESPQGSSAGLCPCDPRSKLCTTQEAHTPLFQHTRVSAQHTRLSAQPLHILYSRAILLDFFTICATLISQKNLLKTPNTLRAAALQLEGHVSSRLTNLRLTSDPKNPQAVVTMRWK